MKKNQQTLGDRICAIRTAKKLTRREVVAEAGCTEDSLYGIERRGQQPNIATLQGIARALDVTVGELLGE